MNRRAWHFLSGVRPLIFIVVCLCASLTSSVFGDVATEPVPVPESRPLEAGLPFTRVMTRLQMRNTQLAKDGSGRVYLGGMGIIRCYDGHVWTDFTVPTAQEIRGIAIDSADRVWIGCSDELGFLEKLPDGSRRYVSINQLIPTEHRDYGYLYDLHVLGDEVFFSATKKVLRLKNGALKIWDIPSHRRLFAATCDDGNIYVHSRGELGLLRFEPGAEEPRVLVKSELNFASTEGAGIIAILKADADTLLLCFTSEGVRILRTDGVLEKPDWEANDYFHSRHIERAILLSDGRYLFATTTGGVLLVDRKGRVQQVLTKANGSLPDDHVTSLLELQPGRVWISTLMGVVEWDLNAGISSFDERLGLEGQCFSLLRHKDRLYAGMDRGLQILRPSSDWSSRASFQFHGVMGDTLMHTTALLELDGRLWCTTVGRLLSFPSMLLYNDGVVFKNTKSADLSGCFDLLALPGGHLIVCGQTELLLLSPWKDGLSLSRHIPLAKARRLLADPGIGGACLALGLEGDVHRVYPNQPDKELELLVKGMEVGRVWHWFAREGKVFLLADSGIWSLEPGARRFERAELQDPQARVWAGSAAGSSAWVLRRISTGATNEEDPAYALYPAMPDPVIGLRESGVPRALLPRFGRLDVAYAESDGVLWLAGTERLLRVDTHALPAPSPPLAARVEWSEFSSSGRRLPLSSEVPVELSGGSSVELAWCAPASASAGPVQFQTRLEGLGDAWSEPSPVVRRRFERLGHGSYRFEVRSLSPLGQPGAVAWLPFVLLPRWYQTWYFYGGLAVLVCLLVLGLLLWNTRLLRRREHVLEEAVQRRTRELRASNELLRQATSAKSDFVRTVSHELRTPLAGARMMADLLLQQGSLGPAQFSQAEKLRGCVNYLQRLLDNTLDLSRFDSGHVPFQLSHFDLHVLLRDTSAFFESLAVAKGLSYEFDFPAPGQVICKAETSHLQRILINFLSNAFKFTTAGSVSLRATQLPNEGAMLRYRFAVSDTGRGVSEQIRHLLFTPFMRSPSVSNGAQEQGAGLGLALCKRLAELNGARIGFDPVPGGGSCFWVEWPLLVASLEPELDAPGQMDFSGLRVLVVEDDPVQRGALVQLLEQLDVSPLAAADAEEAVRILSSESVSLALVDYNLGSQTALTLLEQVQSKDRSGPAAPPMYLMTAQLMDSLRDTAKLSGFVTVLAKPLSLATVCSILADHVSRQSTPTPL